MPRAVETALAGAAPARVREATAVDALRQLAAEPQRAAIFLDVDGTLAPIVDDPADSRVPRRDPRASSSASPAATRSSRASAAARASGRARSSASTS